MSINFVAFDTETWLIRPGIVAPPLVCGSVADCDGRAVLNKELARSVFKAILTESDATIVGANIAFDLICMANDAAKRGVDLMPAIFKAYKDGRVYDIQIAETLNAIANGHVGKDPVTGESFKGRYSLDRCVKLVLGRDDAKTNDFWRLRYALLDDKPFEEWPPEAKQYPKDDAKNTLDVAKAQCGLIPSRGIHNWDGDTCKDCGVINTTATPIECFAKRQHRNLHDLSRQVYAAFCMHLGAAWGFHVDQNAVAKLEAKCEAEREAGLLRFKAIGILRENGTENQMVLKRMVARAYGSKGGCMTCGSAGTTDAGKCAACDGTGYHLPPEVPRTEKDGISKARDALMESGDDLLIAYAEWGEGKKLTSTYLPFLRNEDKDGIPHPGVPITLRPNVLLETGRTSYDGVIQLLPRKGGIRDCIIARHGTVFSSTDYAAGELVTHAQNCLEMVGESELAKALNAGLDAHLALAGTMMGKKYEEVAKLKKEGNKQVLYYRQGAKAANFGLPGGMSELTFTLRKRAEADLFTPCDFGPDLDNGVRGYKGLRPCILMDGAERCGVKKITEYKGKACAPVCERCVKASKDLRESWFKQWPENRKYFQVVQQNLEKDGEVEQRVTKRIRGGVDFTSAANGYFQGRLADAAKNGMCAVVRECYDRTCKSPLFGSRFILFAHDELIVEHPESTAHEAATRVGELMVKALVDMCPDMKAAVKAEPCLMRRWEKGAESVFENGRLVPWKPK